MLLRVLIIVLACLSLTGCDKPTYDAFVYPDQSNLFDYQNIGEYASLEECRIAAKEELKRIGAEEPRGLYQCGKNCLSKSGHRTVAACEDITR